MVRMRYLTCRRCGLKVKTEERLAVPWGDAALVEQVRRYYPRANRGAVGQGHHRAAVGAAECSAGTAGYVISARKGRDAKRLVVCTGEEGRVEQFGLFELRQVCPRAS